MSRFSYADRVKMLAAALEFCPACQEEFSRYAAGQGSDIISFIREQLWKIWGTWDHGAGCPRPVQPEVANRTAQVNTGSSGAGPEAVDSAARSTEVERSIPSNPEHVTGLEIVAPEI